jgi:hypothetical protein
MIADLPPRQIAYFVPDIRAAALTHHRQFGSGPFFVVEHIALARSEHRGMAQPLDHSSAYGQWGALMVEFVQQHNPDPSAYHDLYPHGSGKAGLHHVACFVESLDAAITECAAAGMPLAHYAETATGTPFAFVDASASLGHMLELYQPGPGLTGFYAMVAAAAQGWDGKDPIRTVTL